MIRFLQSIGGITLAKRVYRSLFSRSFLPKLNLTALRSCWKIPTKVEQFLQFALPDDIYNPFTPVDKRSLAIDNFRHFWTSSSIYSSEKVRMKAEQFAVIDGRRPRILMTSALSQHGLAMKSVATGLADLGFDVEICPPCVKPFAIVNLALDNDVHVVAISLVGPGDSEHVAETIRLLRHVGHDCVVVAGGIVANADAELLRNVGIDHIFPMGVPTIEVGRILLDIIPFREFSI